MKPFRVLIAFAALAAAAPAIAQPVYVPPAGSGPSTPSGVTARNVEAIKPPVPETGTANYRITTFDGKCLIPQIRDGRVYLIRPGGCVDGLTLNARFYGGQRMRLEIDRTGTCLVFRHVEMDGSGLRYRSWGQGLSVAPCDESIEQRFRADWATADSVSLRSAGGECWRAADTAIIQYPCDRDERSRFRLSPVHPAGYVAPVSPVRGNAYPGTTRGSSLGTATPVTPPGPVAPPPRPRPAGLPENAPAPGTYWLYPAGSSGGCLRVMAGGAIRLGFDCSLDPESIVQLEWTGSRGFRLANLAPAGQCYATGRRPWIAAEACSPANEQHFIVEKADFRDYYVIKTQSGLCLTLRGTFDRDPARNNSALFPEPCRPANEQYFELYRQD